MALKHVGRVAANQRKVVVAYRVVPGDPDSCLVIQTENLSADEHDALIKAVESAAGQEAYEFGEAMARNTLPDGRNMLAGFHTTGKIRKMPTKEIEMLPNRSSSINLALLNEEIAKQKGITVNDLAITDSKGKTKPLIQPVEDSVDPVATYTETTLQAPTDGVISDEELAAQYRSQADALFKEAKALREQAEELVPTKRKSTKKTTETA
jgi:hypothetical protein